uniref:Integrase catalytic domain-containing protein n=1 Tax=Cacopsylla melanoneura TaxID=428564 RepID=A0A8D8RLR2_9HEMI
MEISERYNVAKEHLICVNCLTANHKAINCEKSCCAICKLKHNTLLHFPQNRVGLSKGKPLHAPPLRFQENGVRPPTNIVPNPVAGISNENKTENVFSSVCAEEVGNHVDHDLTTVLLSTVKVNIYDSFGKAHQLRFLLDSGSMCNLITDSTCKKLNLNLEPSKTILSGIGADSQPVKGQVAFKLTSVHDGRLNYSVQALVVNHIVDKLPVTTIDCSNLNYLENLSLADNEFMKPGNIAGILGAPIYSYILDGKTVVGESNQPVAISTSLGFVIMGNAPVLNNGENKKFCMFQKTQIDQQLERFWELDQVDDCSFSKLTPAEQDCEKQYVDHVTRDLTGRYMVSLPFSSNTSQLGDSFHSAKKRFGYLEKKFQSNPEGSESYKQSMQEMLDKGYMVKTNDQSSHVGYFIPHHMVLKPDSVSTKARVVFDASSKTTSGISLNDILHSGPKLYSDLLGILLNFRLFPCAVNGDITKMFLQILVSESDCKFQRLLWRFDPSEPLTVYEMKVVIFGMKCSPFLAQRTVKQLVGDEIENYPAASDINNFLYMDDCVASFLNEDEAKLFYSDVVRLFKAGGFTFTKWISNSEDVMNEIPESDQLTKLVAFDHGKENVKILGMSWNAKNDFLHFKIMDNDKPCTKRGILSAVLSIYDPMGLLGPLVLWVKLLIREICILKLDWDASPPDHILEAWFSFKNQLMVLEGLEFPRHIGVGLSCEFQLVGFCDASQVGYGAIIYSRVKLPNGNVIVKLICAKSKVAPLKVESIPRLELCALLLLSKLIKLVLDNYVKRYPISSCICLTDSTVALCWCKGSPHLWNTFVANRVSKIQNNLDVENVFHVMGSDNPADSLSRGQMPSEFIKNNIYFNGPNWLLQDREYWPVKSYEDLKGTTEVPEQKPPMVLVEIGKKIVNPLGTLLLKFSSWSKLLNVFVFVLRFLRKLPRNNIITGSDVDVAEQFVVKLIQRDSFGLEIKNIKNNINCSPFLKRLSPIMDGDLLRVGGRLVNASLTFDQQHPMLLPAKHHITNLIVNHYHIINLHAGPQLLLSILRQKFWIIGGRNLVRSITQKCNKCFKNSPKFVFPKMGDLPTERVLTSKPFFHTACDFLGPLNVLIQRRRGSRPVKVYVCLFICMAVKAVHLEVVSELSTSAFLNAFKRFLSRRSPVKSIWSDNGTNFVGAKNKLDEIYTLLDSSEYKDSFGKEMLTHRIEWKFNPPGSPHFGGIFEASVKSFKTHLYRVVGSQLLTLEELMTLTVQIEGVLNSRPLCALSTDPSEVPLTPNHFLNMSALKHIPAECVENTNVNRLTRFQLLDQMVQSFWRKWSLEYLHELQVRAKWHSATSGPIKPGLVVLLRQANTAPLHWPMGVISQVFPGKDGITRVALVKTSRGEFRRAVVNLCPLPNQ